MDYKLKDQNHEFSFNKNNSDSNILTRSGSSVGCSSRIYYHRKPEGIPFQWEKQPGTSKHPPIADSVLPPLSPPPAVLSLGLPKPCLEQPKPQSPWPRFIRSFWRRSRNGNRLSKESNNKRVKPNSTVVLDHDQFFSFDSSEFMAKYSPSCDNSRSSSASSSSLSFSINNNSGRDSFERSLTGCTPWNVNSIVVAISRQIR